MLGRSGSTPAWFFLHVWFLHCLPLTVCCPFSVVLVSFFLSIFEIWHEVSDFGPWQLDERVCLFQLNLLLSNSIYFNALETFPESQGFVGHHW